ncbi:MAG TPA: tRNA dihydrouridine synthase DusB [Clostridiaceae bacterium]|nr:tRNA dihydrouridine synthase DusB [Clostridiaceae bacterium]
MVANQEIRAPHADDCASAGGFLSLFEAPEPIVGLAPMAGFTESSFRSICADEGASFTVTELVSARGIRFDHKLTRSERYLMPTKGERPWGIQLFGFDPDDFSYAIERLLSDPDYASSSFIDINMGCPVQKVVRDGGGAALMKTPELAGEIVAASVKAASSYGTPVTVKIRSGFDADHINAPTIARIAEEAGAAAVTVHARTRDQYYSGQADWQVIRRVRETISIPLFGNGDITSFNDLIRMKSETQCDGFLIGRAARGNPFLFHLIRRACQGDMSLHTAHRCLPCSVSSEKSRNSVGTRSAYRHWKAPCGYNDTQIAESGRTLTFQEQTLLDVPSDYWLEITTRHLDDMIFNLGEYTAIREMRTQFAHYFRGFHGASGLRNRIMQQEKRDGVVALLEEAAQQREASRLIFRDATRS